MQTRGTRRAASRAWRCYSGFRNRICSSRSWRSVTADGARFAHVHGPGMRMAVDMSHPGAPVFNLAGGQSGHPLSSHYSDLLPEWAAGTYRTFQNPAEDVLILRPQQKKPATAEETKP